MSIKLKRKAVISVIIIFILTVCLLYLEKEHAFAAGEQEPDLELYIMNDTENGGPIFHSDGQFGNGLWAPGKKVSGTIRIHNDYSEDMTISNLGIIMQLEKGHNEQYEKVQDTGLYETFAKNMNLTVKKGFMLVFSNTLFDSNFYEMLHDDGSLDGYANRSRTYNGFDLGIGDKVLIPKEDFVDLEYTVEMDEEAGNELQGLRATVTFQINSKEVVETQASQED